MLVHNDACACESCIVDAYISYGKKLIWLPSLSWFLVLSTSFLLVACFFLWINSTCLCSSCSLLRLHRIAIVGMLIDSKLIDSYCSSSHGDVEDDLWLLTMASASPSSNRAWDWRNEKGTQRTSTLLSSPRYHHCDHHHRRRHLSWPYGQSHLALIHRDTDVYVDEPLRRNGFRFGVEDTTTVSWKWICAINCIRVFVVLLLFTCLSIE